MNQAANRISPAGRPQDYKTYSIASPLSTHTRVATCEEVECEAHINGWVSAIDVSTELGQQQANYIRLHAGRHVSAVEADGSLIKFTFPPGQKCFTEHRVGIDRPALYVVRGGDWRGNPAGIRPVKLTSDQWVDDFATHQQRVSDAIQKG